jgi:hypothetical protein
LAATDYAGMVAGVMLLLPVYEPGALLYIGDGHARQGHADSHDLPMVGRAKGAGRRGLISHAVQEYQMVSSVEG